MFAMKRDKGKASGPFLLFYCPKIRIKLGAQIKLNFELGSMGVSIHMKTPNSSLV